MEDVYTIKVKTKPDKRNVYPSERRYSASTVSGIAWVHIALAATSFLLACLALVNPSSDIKRLTLNDTEEKTVDHSELMFNLANFDVTSTDATEIYNDERESTNASNLQTNEENNGTSIVNENTSSLEVNNYKKKDSTYILVLAPTLLTVSALAAGTAAVMASARWYIDRNITWFFLMSVLSTIFSFISFTMITVWLATTDSDPSDSYKLNVKDFFIVKSSDVVHRNESHMVIKTNYFEDEENDSHIFSKLVLSINILIACFLELLWSMLSVKIAYKGMRNNYKDENERRGNCISVVTTIKGNTKKLPRNGKLIPPKSDLIDHYPSTKIKKIFLTQGDNGFYLKNQNNKQKNTETSSEFYKERMMNFLNRCADGNNSEIRTPSEPESVLNVIPEITDVEVTTETDPVKDSRMTPLSWGDSSDHTVYNQNTLNLDKIFNFKKGDQYKNMLGNTSSQNQEEKVEEINEDSACAVVDQHLHS